MFAVCMFILMHVLQNGTMLLVGRADALMSLTELTGSNLYNDQPCPSKASKASPPNHTEQSRPPRSAANVIAILRNSCRCMCVRVR